MEKLVIGVEGMSCGGCVVSVENAVGRVVGVSRAKASLEAKEVLVEGEKLDLQKLKSAIEDAGYDIRPGA
jgi:copper chaperone